MRASCSAIILGCLLTLSACSRKPAQDTGDQAPATSVEVAVAQRKSMESVVTAEAVLYPLKQATIVPKISAPVQRFLAQRGDHVTEGQLVAVLEARDLAASAQESKELFEQAQATYQNTTSATMPDDLTRAQSDAKAAQEALSASVSVYESRVQLFKEGALAQKLVEDAKVARVQAESALVTAQQHLQSLKTVGGPAQLKAAQAQMNAAQAHYASSEAQLSYSQVRSPISGIVSDRPLNVGEMATSGSALLSVVDISRVVARANLPVTTAAKLKLGQTAEISEGDVKAKGKVTVISPAVDPNATTVQIWVAASNPGERLKLGTTAHITVNTGELAPSIVVPVTALLPSDEGGEKVMVAGSDSVAHDRKVEVGVRTTDEAQIITGVKAGEQVIVSGALGLDDNAKVEIAKTGAETDKKGEK